MANIPQSLNMKAAPFEAGSSASSALGGPQAVAGNKDRKMQSAEQLVLDLCNPDLRENALLELSKKRELFQDLAPLLWNSFGTIAALLQEIVSIYPVLSPPNLTPAQSNRVCNALALFQIWIWYANARIGCVQKKEATCWDVLIKKTVYLNIALGRISKLTIVEQMSLGFELFCSHYLLILWPIALWLQGVATFIVQKILLDDVGLDYVCTTAERFFAVGRVLGNMVAALAEQPSVRLLKHIIRCYLRLSDNARACDALRSCLPDILRDATFSSCLRIQPLEGGCSSCFTMCKCLGLLVCKQGEDSITCL
ncbi:cell differentiation RCD1 homolog isoform X1 [Olea europaea subsp. europaea]|uniref:Cell differentiation RCD1 homolog isoform X1 n=1 Tax=Olea europaea subsp. europaea TaxID=158383 RepID=A0A8S0U2J7_OLEEU|nr:cell differentiation RCD1 homolog isoform X1 [Olea europaea subsp. europaea]